MIEKIIRLQNVGLLQDACASGNVDLNRVTGIFADNGRGKSTFAAILRACHLADAERLMGRQTINSGNPPEIDFLLPNGNHVRFDGSAWVGTAPGIVIFDSEFVEQNVYSGFEVRPDQRQSLLDFALGDQTVLLKVQVEQLTHDIAEQTTKWGQAERTLSGCMQPYTLADFISLAPVPDAQAQIDALHKRVEAAKNAEQLAARQNPSELQLVQCDADPIFDILAKELSDVEDSAEAVVKAHLLTKGQPALEQWISSGQQYLSSDDCPFCGQGTKGLELIRAYRTHFNENYQALKREVAALEKIVMAAFAAAKSDQIAGAVETNNARIQAWADQLQLSVPALDRNALQAEFQETREFLLALVEKKEKQPLVAVNGQQARDRTAAGVAAINNHLMIYNSELAGVTATITEFKLNLAAENPTVLQTEIKKLEAAIKRQKPDVVVTVGEYQSAEAKRKCLEGEKAQARKNIDGLMATTLEQYQTKINQLLSTFGAEFSIEKLKPSYVGSGDPRTEYGLSLRKKSVKLGSRGDTAKAPTFATALSEADKRTLTFSSFIARIHQRANPPNKVLVLDDPVSSLDRNRRHKSIHLICAIAARCRQLLVLSHDAYFVRDLRDTLANQRPAPVAFPIWTLNRVQGGYSAFGRCDIDATCASDYYRHHRMVSDFVAGTSAADIREVAKAIRPLLEGYYHRRFPGCIPKRQMFGQIIAFAVDPTTTGPLVHLRPLEAELRDVNDYAAQFHHDTNQSADTAPVVDSELLYYAEKTLNLIYQNG